MPIYPVVLHRSALKIVFVEAPSKKAAGDTAYEYAFELWTEEEALHFDEIKIQPYDEREPDEKCILTNRRKLRKKYGKRTGEKDGS